MNKVTILGFLLSVWPYEGQAEVKEIKVGVIAGLTGAFAEIGRGAARTIELACNQWNQQLEESSARPRVSCFFEDDGFDTKKGASGFLKLQAVNKIDALINVNSTTLSAIKNLVDARNLPTMQVFMENGVSQPDTVFQICPEVEIAEEQLGVEVAKKYPGKIVVVMSINDAVTRLADAFERGLGRSVQRVEIPVESSDVRSEVLKLVSSNPAAIMFITTPDHGALVEKELRALKVRIPRIFDANFVSAIDTYKKLVGDLTALEPSMLMNIGMPESEERTEFKAAYKVRYGSEPPPWSEYSYDAFTVLMNAYAPDKGEWLKRIQATNLQGISGKIEFSAKGVTKPVYELTTVGEVLRQGAR